MGVVMRMSEFFLDPPLITVVRSHFRYIAYILHVLFCMFIFFVAKTT